MTYTVYKIEYQGRVMYVGKTKQFKRRVYEHKHYRGGTTSAIPTDVDLNDVEFIPIETFDNETDALLREDELIQEYDTINNGWNEIRSGLIRVGDIKAYEKERRNKPQRKAYMKQFAVEHADERKAYMKEYHKQWHLKHHEEQKEKHRQYYYEHRDEINEKHRQYYQRKKNEI